MLDVLVNPLSFGSQVDTQFIYGVNQINLNCARCYGRRLRLRRNHPGDKTRRRACPH